MIKISDAVKLLSAGFKADEIREMIKTEKEAPEPVIEQNAPVTENVAPVIEQSAPVTEPDAPDYEALYKKALSDLSAAQAENRNKDVKLADIKSEYEKAIELFR